MFLWVFLHRDQWAADAYLQWLLSESQTKLALFFMRPEKCEFILPYMSFVQKWPLCTEAFQKSHWLFIPSKKRKTKKGKSQTLFNTLKRGLWRQRLKWGVMENTSPLCFWRLSSLVFVLFYIIITIIISIAVFYWWIGGCEWWESSDFHWTELMESRAPLVDRGSISQKEPFRTACM